MALASRQCMPFYPKADSTFLLPLPEQRAVPARPQTTQPIHDPVQLNDPLVPFTTDAESCFYPPKTDTYAPSSIPPESAHTTKRYIRPYLAENERLRLSTVWYYTRDLDAQADLLAGLQEKACLAQESSGWEYAVIGILDINVYIRLATVGLEVAILPRGETLCAHTVNQPPGNVFLLPNMMEDWRFRDSPYVELGGLKAYAGVPLRMHHESGECVSLGSLCVASSTSQDPLPRQQQQTLSRLADWIVRDIMESTRARRQRERRRMVDLIASVQNDANDSEPVEAVLKVLRDIYPGESVSLQASMDDEVDSREQYLTPLSDSKNGLWEDTAYINEIILNSNQHEPPVDKVIRYVYSPCESRLGSSILVVGTKDFRRMFDDVDSWFVQTCATILSQRWQKYLLSEAISVKEKFLRGMSHQLRTPLHGILGAAELLTQDLDALFLSASGALRPELMELLGPAAGRGQSGIYLDTISTAGQELMSTVNSLITLNRWADIAMADRQIDLHAVSELETELAKALSATTIPGDHRPRASVFFHHDVLPECSSFRIDLNLLRDSVLPLINNALQYTAQGLVTVTLSTRPDSRVFVVNVQDTGCGICTEDQKRIFDLFNKVDEHSTSAGLGLTIANKFSMLLNGSVELVTSCLGGGSHFRATFRDVDYQISTTLPQPKMPKFEYLPAKFHYLDSRFGDVPLSAHFMTFLIRNGFTATECSDACLTILDYVPDLEQRRTYYANLPEGQAAICLVPTSEEGEPLEANSNIVYVNGPFSTSRLTRALEEANKQLALSNGILMSETCAIPRKSFTKNASGGPLADDWPESDEGYGSTGLTPSATEPTQISVDLASTFTEIIVSPSDVQVQDVANSAPLTQPLPASTDLSKPRALLVDDNIVNLRILEIYCMKRGIDYCSATNGRHAVSLFIEQQALSAAGRGAPIELILMDLQMPVCNGIEATQQIRELERKNGWHTSVLMMITGQDSRVDREAASDAGADDYLVKPVGMKHLDRGLAQFFPARVGSLGTAASNDGMRGNAI